MKQIVSPKDTDREQAYRLWIKSPMPMVTLTKTFDITHLYRISRRRNKKFNLLLCHAILQSAQDIHEFYTLPEQGTLYRYDRLAINVIVPNKDGGINSCDIPYSPDLDSFEADYLRLTHKTAQECRSLFLEDCMIIGTSALVQTEIDSITNQYTELFSNPFLAWGRYRRRGFRYRLPLSFQFHHVQMDGAQAAQFLEDLQSNLSGYRL